MSHKIIGIHSVRSKVGDLSRSTLWRLEEKGLFPKRKQISANRVGWLESEIDTWIEEKLNAGRGQNKQRGEI